MPNTSKTFSIPLLKELVEAQRQLGKKTVLVHGVFDLIHCGHVSFLAEAKKQADILIVGIESDANVKVLKGSNRPIYSHASRIYILSHLACVDYLFLIPPYDDLANISEFYCDLYRTLNADLLATRIEAGKYGILMKDHAEKAGMKFVNLKMQFHCSTTKLIEQIKALP